MRFQIPQFIDVEDKILGPLTLKQFIYLAGGVSAAVALVLVLGKFLGLLIATPILALAGALAFYKVNNRPFIFFLESAFNYLLKDKLYIWKKTEPETQKEDEPSQKFTSIVVPNLSNSKLKSLNWELDVRKKENEMLEKSS